MTDDDKTRWAIDVMTAWHHDDIEFFHQRIDAYTAEPQGCAGLVNLSGLLLSGMEATIGKSSDPPGTR